MRIAQVCPLSESVPPKLYGGTERVVAFLTEELVAAGHHVTLFASGDSVTRAELVACVPRALRLDGACIDPIAPHVLMIEEVVRRAADFDLIHFHDGYLHFPLMRRLGIPRVTTVHGRLDIPDLQKIYRGFPDEPLVSISEAQRAPLPGVGWQGTVYHGLPDGLFTFHPGPGQYLAFLGRISPEKGPDRAIEIARRAGMPLKIAAKVDRVDEEYFAARIKPLLGDPSIEFVGEIDEDQKDDFLGNAAAVLFPVDWPEPFGLVMIEAFACGTPVVAFARGSVPEVMRDGLSGFVVGTVDEAVAAVPRALELSRARCRAYFEDRFTAARMAAAYVRLYEKMIARERSRRAAAADEAGDRTDDDAELVAESAVQG
ncbi:MAG TPA: glycosyltransferase family 4 protein [Polyangia bacterium]|nr:glycosyltransferase family 4 protein [Polyangia bacterium]